MSRNTSRKRRSYRNASPRIVTPQSSSQALELSSKVNPAYAAMGTIYYGDLPAPHTMDRNYKSYSKEAYAGNDTIHKCIGYIITNGAAIPPKLYTDRNMKKEIEKHPLLDKLARPNPEQSGVAFRKAVLGYFLIAGNSFIYAIRNKTAPPDELWTLQPDKVKVLASPTRGVSGYLFDDFDDSKNPIPAENIGFLRTWNPLDPIYGLSSLSVGAIKVDMQSAALKWHLSLLQNHSKMSGAWSTDAILSPNDRSKLEDRLNNKFAGYRNAGRVPVLDGGLKWNQMSVPPAQMDWLDALKYNAGSLANLYNIPPQLIGDTSSTTYDNMEQAKAASYTEEIFPVNDEFYDMLNSWLLPMYPDLKNAYLYYDKDSVEVVQAVIQQQKDAKAKRAFQAWALGATSSCTLNEAREMQGLPPDPQGDVYRFGQVIVKVGELDKYAEQSLQKPAAPPMPVPEPELNVPDPNQPPPEPPVPPTKPGSKPPKNEQEEEEPPASGKKPGKKSREAKSLSDFSDGTHGLWNCAPGACAFCLENDGQIVSLGDEFPNGCTSPDDCHRACKCELTVMSIPDGADISGLSKLALATLYGIGLIAASQRDKEPAQDDTQEVDYADDDEESKSYRGAFHADKADITYDEALAILDMDTKDTEDAVSTKGVSRQEYRAFMESTLR